MSFGPTRPVPAINRFLKTYQSDALISERALLSRRSTRVLLEHLLKWTNDSGILQFSGDRPDRERMASSLSRPGLLISEETIRRSLGELASSHRTTLLIRLSRSRYMFNPEHFFIGTEEKRLKVMNKVWALRAAEAKKKRNKAECDRIARGLVSDCCPSNHENSLSEAKDNVVFMKPVSQGEDS